LSDYTLFKTIQTIVSRGLAVNTSGGASPLFVAAQSQDISRISKGCQHIDIRAPFYQFRRFKCFLLYQRLQSSEHVER